LRLTDPLHRNHVVKQMHIAIGRAHVVWRLRRTWAHRVDADTLAGILLCDGLCETDNRVLARHVMGDSVHSA
jgi:hypothetical protein